MKDVGDVCDVCVAMCR